MDESVFLIAALVVAIVGALLFIVLDTARNADGTNSQSADGIDAASKGLTGGVIMGVRDQLAAFWARLNAPSEQPGRPEGMSWSEWAFHAPTTDEERAIRRERKDRERSARHKRARNRAMKIDGKPWWLSDRRQMVTTYKAGDDLEEQLQTEMELANEHGWFAQSTDTDGGHINVGRTATGAVLTGGLSLLFGGSRSKGEITLVWRRDVGES